MPCSYARFLRSCVRPSSFAAAPDMPCVTSLRVPSHNLLRTFACSASMPDLHTLCHGDELFHRSVQHVHANCSPPTPAPSSFLSPFPSPFPSQRLTVELMRKMDSELKHEICHWAAFYVRLPSLSLSLSLPLHLSPSLSLSLPGVCVAPCPAIALLLCLGLVVCPDFHTIM